MAERHKLTHARPQDFMKPKLEADNPQRPTGVAVQRVVRPPHPWSQTFNAKQKLAAARKEAQRRHKLEYKKDNIEWIREQQVQSYRAKHGLQIEQPKIKSGRPRTVA